VEQAPGSGGIGSATSAPRAAAAHVPVRVRVKRVGGACAMGGAYRAGSKHSTMLESALNGTGYKIHRLCGRGSGLGPLIYFIE